MQCSKYFHSTLNQSRIMLNFRFWHNSHFFSSCSVILIKHLTLQDFTILNYFYSTELLSLAYLACRAWQKVFCAAYLFFRKIYDIICGSQKDADGAVGIVCSSVAEPEPGCCSCEESFASKGGESLSSGCQHILKCLQLCKLPGIIWVIETNSIKLETKDTPLNLSESYKALSVKEALRGVPYFVSEGKWLGEYYVSHETLIL